MTTYITSLPPELKITGMHRFRGNMYQKAGDHQKAIADLTTEIKYWGADVDASLYQERAASYLAVGNKVAAKQDLQWVVDYYQKLGSEYEQMREAAVKELTAVK
jgi:tetratricopeptide (TPR) repeat protein